MLALPNRSTDREAKRRWQWRSAWPSSPASALMFQGRTFRISPARNCNEGGW